MKYNKKIYYKNIKQLYLIYFLIFPNWTEERKFKFWTYTGKFWEGM